MHEPMAYDDTTLYIMNIKHNLPDSVLALRDWSNASNSKRHLIGSAASRLWEFL